MTSIQLKAATRQDPVLNKVLHYTKRRWPLQVPESLKPYWNRRMELSLEDDCVIHIDFAGPFLGRTFMVVVDAHSKWPEVIEMKTTTASSTIQELRTLFASYGLPEQLDPNLSQGILPASSSAMESSTSGVLLITPLLMEQLSVS